MSEKCYLNGTCNLADKPLETILRPLSDAFTIDIAGTSFDFTILIFWSLILTVIWMRTHRIEIVSIVGLLVASSLSASLPDAAQRVGYLLIAISIGVLLFDLISQRIIRR